MPRISVILPVYNASKYLIESLESLSNTFENKKYQIYLEIYKSHSITL